MKFIRSDSPQKPAAQIASIINSRLRDGGKVCWFLSGGSAITVAVAACELLTADVSRLTVTLADERFGPPGHANSNWQQLLDSGFKLPGASLQPVLNGLDVDATTAGFNELVAKTLTGTYKIALLGMGTDGHMAGILPGSPAVTSDELIVCYDAAPYKRITLTAAALSKMDAAVAYVLGDAKHPQLQKLAQDLPAGEQPAQILKKIPEVWVYNDLKGGNI